MQTEAESYPGQSVTTTDPGSGHDWKADLEERWQALGRRIFVDGAEQPPSLREVISECEQLVAVWALVQKSGNLTSASSWVACSRRRLRETLHAWLDDHPSLVPMPLVVFMKWSEGRGGDR